MFQCDIFSYYLQGLDKKRQKHIPVEKCLNFLNAQSENQNISLEQIGTLLCNLSYNLKLQVLTLKENILYEIEYIDQFDVPKPKQKQKIQKVRKNNKQDNFEIVEHIDILQETNTIIQKDLDLLQLTAQNTSLVPFLPSPIHSHFEIENPNRSPSIEHFNTDIYLDQQYKFKKILDSPFKQSTEIKKTRIKKNMHQSIQNVIFENIQNKTFQQQLSIYQNYQQTRKSQNSYEKNIDDLKLPSYIPKKIQNADIQQNRADYFTSASQSMAFESSLDQSFMSDVSEKVHLAIIEEQTDCFTSLRLDQFQISNMLRGKDKAKAFYDLMSEVQRGRFKIIRQDEVFGEIYIEM